MLKLKEACALLLIATSLFSLTSCKKEVGGPLLGPLKNERIKRIDHYMFDILLRSQVFEYQDVRLVTSKRYDYSFGNDIPVDSTIYSYVYSGNQVTRYTIRTELGITDTTFKYIYNYDGQDITSREVWSVRDEDLQVSRYQYEYDNGRLIKRRVYSLDDDEQLVLSSSVKVSYAGYLPVMNTNFRIDGGLATEDTIGIGFIEYEEGLPVLWAQYGYSESLQDFRYLSAHKYIYTGSDLKRLEDYNYKEQTDTLELDNYWDYGYTDAGSLSRMVEFPLLLERSEYIIHYEEGRGNYAQFEREPFRHGILKWPYLGSVTW